MVINNRSSGFTIVEILITMAIVGLVVGGIMGIISSTSTYHTKQEMMVSLTQDLRATKHLMTDEIRSAGSNPENETRIGFQDDGDDMYNTDANSIHFTRDIDNDDGDHFLEPDGDADDPFEEIVYYRVDSGGNLLDPGNNIAGTLVRRSDSGDQPVINNVTDLQFIYYDDDDNVIDPATLDRDSNLDDIRMVEVVLSGQVLNPNRVVEDIQTSQFKITVRNAGI